jgi:hypothetical protein
MRMKFSQALPLITCLVLGASSSASACSLSAQDAQETPPISQPTDQALKKPANKKQDKKNPPANAIQPASGQPATTSAQPDKAPQPLFGGQVNLKSSRQSKDTATLGFNGLDPNGQVQKGFLAAAPTAADLAKAQQLTRTGVNPSELNAFMQEGGLNATGGQ